MYKSKQTHNARGYVVLLETHCIVQDLKNK